MNVILSVGINISILIWHAANVCGFHSTYFMYKVCTNFSTFTNHSLNYKMSWHSRVFTQNAHAQKRIKLEINWFETEEGIFEKIQKKVMSKVQSLFTSMESELKQIELAIKEGPEFSPVTGPGGRVSTMLPTEEATAYTYKSKLGQENVSPILIPLGVVIGTFALPFVGIKNLKKQMAAKKQLKAYRSDKAAEMSRITLELVKELLESDKLNDVIKEKFELLKRKFDFLLDRIPNLIAANKKLLSELGRELDEINTDDYSLIYEAGLTLMDKLNFLYMTEVRTYDINLKDIHDKEGIAEGSFGEVYSGNYEIDGVKHLVAVKMIKEALTEQSATEFLLEELNLM